MAYVSVMGTSDTAPHWVRTWASDLAAGDTIRLADDADDPGRLVADRTYTSAWEVAFWITYEDDTGTGLVKSSLIWIHDPDGSVTKRIRYALGHRP